jgi:hypothetical protein
MFGFYIEYEKTINEWYTDIINRATTSEIANKFGVIKKR